MRESSMKPRDVVLEQIYHRDMTPVPYYFEFNPGVDNALDTHFGSSNWREQLTPYIVDERAVDTTKPEPISDIRVRDVFGGLWRNDLIPLHQEEPAMKEPSFDDYVFPTPDRFLGDGQKEKARMTLEKHPDSFRVVRINWGLFEQSWRIRGFENALMDAAAEPDFYAELLDRLTELYMVFVEECRDLPADAIMFSDDWGDQRSVILGPERWREFLKPRWARLYEAVHAQGKIAISHCCGSVADIMPDIIEIGLDVLESVQPEAASMNPYELKKRWGDRITFWGCLGSQSIIPFGTPEQIKDEVKRLCTEMGKGGGYILASTKPLQIETPIENVVAVFESFVGQT